MKFSVSSVSRRMTLCLWPVVVVGQFGYIGAEPPAQTVGV